jgi:hypothetical protein
MGRLGPRMDIKLVGTPLGSHGIPIGASLAQDSIRVDPTWAHIGPDGPMGHMGPHGALVGHVGPYGPS